MSTKRWNRAQMQGRRVYWLLDLTYAGAAYRLSTIDLDVSSVSGDLHYIGGLSEATLTEGLDLLGESGEPVSVPLEVLMPVDVAALSAAGHDLALATGELSRWIEGTIYEDRKIFVTGRVSDPEYAGADLPIRFSLEDRIFEDEALMPPAGAVVNRYTAEQNTLDDFDLEISYPIIIGHPGVVMEGQNTSGSIAPWFRKQAYHHQVVIAGHRVQCQFVHINNDGFTDGAAFEVNHIADKLGREIAVVLEANSVGPGTTPVTGAPYFPGLDSAGVDPSFQPARTQNVPLFVKWADPDDPARGGLVGESGALLRGAGDVIEYVLRQSSRRVDFGRIRAVKDRLNGFKLDFSIGERVSPWEFVRDNLLPLLPVTVTNGTNGLYLVVLDYAATAADAVVNISEDAHAGVEMGQYIKTDSAHVANQFSLSYAYSERAAAYTQTLVMGAANFATYSRGDIIVAGMAIVRLVSVNPGAFGGGYTIRAVAAGALAVSENVGAKTITLAFVSGVTDCSAMITAINNALTSVTATQVTGLGTVTFSLGAIGITASGSEQTVTMEGTGDAVDLPSYFCALSQWKHRGLINPTGLVEKAIDSRCIFDPATAAMVLSWQARALSLPWRRLDVLLPEADFAWLERGNVVTVSSARLSLSNKVAHVEAMETADDGMIAMTLLLLQDPPMDNRA